MHMSASNSLNMREAVRRITPYPFAQKREFEDGVATRPFLSGERNSDQSFPSPDRLVLALRNAIITLSADCSTPTTTHRNNPSNVPPFPLLWDAHTFSNNAFIFALQKNKQVSTKYFLLMTMYVLR